MNEEPTGVRHEVWATPLFEVRNPDHEKIRPGLVEYFQRRERNAQTAVESGVTANIKRNLFESRFDLFEADIAEVRLLTNFCRAAVDDAVAMLAGETGTPPPAFEIHESWIHITRDGGHHDYHGHPGCFWCGIYYVDMGDCDFETRNGCNRFYNPIPTFFRGGSGRRHDFIDIEPENGKVVLFPSYLQHSALPYRGDRERVLIAFNSRLLEPAG